MPEPCENRASSRLLRSAWLPWGVVLGLTALTFYFVVSLRSQEDVELNAITQVTGEQIKRQFEIWFGERQQVLLDLASRLPTTDEATYLQEARTFRTWFPGFQAMSWVDADGTVRLVEPVEGNQQVIGFNLHAHDDPSVSVALSRAMTTHTVTRSDFLQLKQGGQGFGTYAPIQGTGGELLGFVNGVFRVDDAFRICLENERFLTDFGIELAELGRGIANYGLPSPDVQMQAFEILLFDRPLSMRIGPSASLVRRGHGIEANFVLGIGTIASVLAGLTLHFRRSRNLQREVAKRRREKLEHELQQALKMESIGRLAGGIAHDFNNYLTAILGCGEMLMRDLDPLDARRPYAALAVQAGMKAARVTRQLLAFARKQETESRVIAPNVLIHESIEILHHALGDGIELRCNLDPELSAVLVDPVQFDQVLLNLALNARDAMPNGGVIEILTRNLGPGEEGSFIQLAPEAKHWVQIQVSDNGVGMHSDVCEKIFEPFFSTKQRKHGTGLGLSTCYGIVKQAGGLIEVSSEPGRGTKFSIYLPASDDEPVDEEEDLFVAASQRRAGGRVLLVEDEPLVRAVAESMLTKAGYEVLSAQDGQDALELLERRDEPIDILITDLMMPRLGGRELAATLKLRMPGLPVIFISGYDDVSCEPGEVLVTKPFEIASLLKAISHGLGSV